MWEHRIFFKIKSCHAIGMLRPILWSLGASSTPKVVGSGAAVWDRHDCSTPIRTQIYTGIVMERLCGASATFPERSLLACGATMPCASAGLVLVTLF